MSFALKYPKIMADFDPEWSVSDKDWLDDFPLATLRLIDGPDCLEDAETSDDDDDAPLANRRQPPTGGNRQHRDGCRSSLGETPLPNLGNTCFANSVIQLLRALPINFCLFVGLG